MNQCRLALSVVTFLMSIALTSCREENAAGVDSAAYQRASSTIVTTEAALQVSDDILGFDPVLDRLHTADQNAMAVEMHARDSLVGCGTVSRSGTTITIDFGATPCATPSGHLVTGSIELTIAARTAEAAATLTFTSVTIDGTALSGTLGFTTTVTGLTVDVALTGGTSSIAGSATIGATAGAFALDANLTSMRSGATTMITVSGLVWARGDCYPSAGTVSATTGRLVQSITFSSTTAMSGVVTVTEGRLTSSETLPAYGDCPVP